MKKKILLIIIFVIAIFFIEPQMINRVNAKETLHVMEISNADFLQANREEIRLKMGNNQTEIVPVEGIKLDFTKKELTVGDTMYLNVTISPSNATIKAVTWYSSNPSVVSIDSTGRITALKPGSALIKVKAVDGGKIDICTIVVNPKENSVEKIELNFARKELIEGESFTLKPTIIPSNATNKTIVWNSNHKEIATVDQNGEVTAVKEGMAQITATTVDGNKSATCLVIVKNKSSVITSDEFRVNEAEKLIEKVPTGMTKQEFLEKIRSTEAIKIYKNGRELFNNEKVGTGTIVRIGNDTTYTVVVLGDVNGDGELTVVDLAKCKLHTIWKENLTGYYEKAVDFNGDKVVNIVDLSRLKLKLIGKI